MAFQIARTYVLGTIKSCNKTQELRSLYEKYNPFLPGIAGGGGEYENQLGFGWTNGVLVDFITTYGDDLIEAVEYMPTMMKNTYGINQKKWYKSNLLHQEMSNAKDNADILKQTIY